MCACECLGDNSIVIIIRDGAARGTSKHIKARQAIARILRACRAARRRRQRRRSCAQPKRTLSGAALSAIADMRVALPPGSPCGKPYC